MIKANNYMGNVLKEGWGVNNLPLYIDGKNTGEKVIYIGDLPEDRLEVVTDKTFYYDIDLDKKYVVVENDRVIINTAYNWEKFVGDKYAM